jgi:UDP-glucose 4-epimerase
MMYELKDTGQRLAVIDNLSPGHRWAVSGVVSLVTGDVGNQRLVGEVIKEYNVDAIIHFAGSIVLPDSIKSPLVYYHNNTVKSGDLIACTVYSGV